MEAIQLPDAPIDFTRLAATLRGTLIRPGDEGYEDARRIHDKSVDRRPAGIVRAADARDVARAVGFARSAGLEIAVRSGGHSIPGHSTVDGGLVIDMSAMKGLHIDPAAKVARAESGLTAGEYTTAAAEFGLATPFGDTSSVGIAGLTLGGGIGYLVRKHGLAIVDSLLGVEVVTADGRIVNASADENADLFWAVRGGGGNFGVVTRFTYRLHEVGMTYGGGLMLPLTKATLRGFADLSAAAPDELSMIAFVMAAPPMPFIAPEHVGTPALMITLVYAGDPAEGERVVAPLKALATPLADLTGVMPYPAIYRFTEGADVQMPPLVGQSTFVSGLDDAGIDEILARHRDPAVPFVMTQLRVLGGQMARVPAGATAFAHRDAHMMVMVLAAFEGDPTPVLGWVADYLDTAFAGKRTGVYSNFLHDEGEARIRDAYPGDTYTRLAAIKRRWDPTNVFHRNQNIRPQPQERAG
jgi:FAD/FMN-containing dehydrogenase